MLWRDGSPARRREAPLLRPRGKPTSISATNAFNSHHPACAHCSTNLDRSACQRRTSPRHISVTWTVGQFARKTTFTDDPFNLGSSPSRRSLSCEQEGGRNTNPGEVSMAKENTHAWRLQRHRRGHGDLLRKKGKIRSGIAVCRTGPWCPIHGTKPSPDESRVSTPQSWDFTPPI
jgi:hypothetical protein